jgi:uncharacterized protein YktA (UPF0223 family)
MDEYKIDYDMFTVEEIIRIINFFRLIEQTKSRKISRQILTDEYREYRNIINNKALEKKYDKMLFEMSGVSIYQVMKKLQ